MADNTNPELSKYGLSSSAEQRKLFAQVDLLAIPLVVLLFAGIFSFHFALLVGDWDYWVDWRDRRWWPALFAIIHPLCKPLEPLIYRLPLMLLAHRRYIWFEFSP